MFFFSNFYIGIMGNGKGRNRINEKNQLLIVPEVKV